MQLVDGESLDERIPDGGLPLPRLLDLAVGLADGVAAAHHRGVMHRDLKPSNVMVGRDGRPMILDFGLAKFAAKPAGLDSEMGKSSQHLTGEGTMLGTVSYMSPEQIEGGEIDARSDVFALGIMLYQMAVGDLPFKGKTPGSVIAAITRDNPPPVTELNHALPRDLARIVRRCLEKDPERRFQSAKDLRNDLQDLQREIESGNLPPVGVAAAGPAGGHAQARPAGGRGGRERVAWALVAVLVAALGFLGFRAWPGSAAAEAQVLRLATGSPDGVYYPLGQGIARVLEREIEGLQVDVLVTEGSFENVRLMEQGEAELSLVQNDVVFNAVRTDRLLGYRSANIGGIAVLFEEVAQIIARKDAEVGGVRGLPGKRLNVDLPQSGTRFTTELVLESFGIALDDVAPSFLPVTEISGPLMAGDVDATWWWRALPSPFVRDFFVTGDFELVPIEQELIEGLRSSQPFLTPVTIPALTYPNQMEPISSVAVKATLVASTSLDAALVERITEVIFSSVADLIAHHPRAGDIDPDRSQRLEDGMAIDLHPGAERYRLERSGS
jgi:TRAP transporter TAXI family solute receptor